jgi:hypothetical protein
MMICEDIVQKIGRILTAAKPKDYGSTDDSYLFVIKSFDYPIDLVLAAIRENYAALDCDSLRKALAFASGVDAPSEVESTESSPEKGQASP